MKHQSTKSFTKETAIVLFVGAIFSVVGIVGNAYLLLQTIQSGLTIPEILLGSAGGVVAFLLTIFGIQRLTFIARNEFRELPLQ